VDKNGTSSAAMSLLPIFGFSNFLPEREHPLMMAYIRTLSW
jgi:hypothetical protein